MIKDVEQTTHIQTKTKTTYFWGPAGVTLSNINGSNSGSNLHKLGYKLIM